MNSRLSVAIIDIIGIPYDGTTLEKRGLGGSESAVILISRELVRLGIDVTVYNNCVDDAKPGDYEGVTYYNHNDVGAINGRQKEYDVIISSRNVYPFVPTHLGGGPWSRFEGMVKGARHKVVWMHDTFCGGDELLEPLVAMGAIDEVWTLSDFHTNYVTSCTHGVKRMFEVLKKHIWQTRNGITLYKDYVDLDAKDPDLFVYNASVTKGMIPLVENIWANIKACIPGARLKIVGGYYRFRASAEPDAQEKKWRQMVANPEYARLGIEFTGIITQEQIADILSEASFMLYPGAFPETFGISTLESLAYHTPLITTRFGALEETALDQASYMINYPIEPNPLFPTINKANQEKEFFESTIRAHADKYLHKQKMQYCGVVKEVCGWDTVALQWKQHLFKKLDRYLTVYEYRKVSAINARVHELFGRRFMNLDEVYLPRNPERRIVVITAMFNAEDYIQKCIDSVISQDYTNWRMIIVDDWSSDNSVAVANTAAGREGRITVYENGMNVGALKNQVEMIREQWHNDIIMLLDGDDWLACDNQIFQRYNNIYHAGYQFTYGSSWSLTDNIPLVAQEYPPEVLKNRSYRTKKFAWNMPYTHLRTFLAGLLNGIEDDVFKDENLDWYKAGGDGALFYALIEKVDPAKINVVKDITYIYNDKNPLNDYKVNGEEQTRNATRILEQ